MTKHTWKDTPAIENQTEVQTFYFRDFDIYMVHIIRQKGEFFGLQQRVIFETKELPELIEVLQQSLAEIEKHKANKT